VEAIESLKAFEQIKVLADARRLAILRLLMAQPASLTQLGQILDEHPAWVRHHLKQLEAADLVEISQVRSSGGVVEKFYRAKARAFVIRELILPDDPSKSTLIFSGSHDLALELLAEEVAEHTNLLLLPVGSLDGLINLRQGLAHLAGCHLYDADSGQYNRPYVHHFFPDQPMSLVSLAERQQGLIVAPGNPRYVRSLADLAREDLTFINRNRGSGTRLWLDGQLQRLWIPVNEIRGYAREVNTHTGVARAVAEAQANVGLGLQAAAQRFGLGFIPLFQEHYDLVIPQASLTNRNFIPLLDRLQSVRFRQNATALGGYDTAHTGEQITL
jgi:putative molybdopterin biosynthesis protein